MLLNWLFPLTILADESVVSHVVLTGTSSSQDKKVRKTVESRDCALRHTSIVDFEEQTP